MMGSFGYEYVVSGPDPAEIIKGLAIPGCSDCGRPQLLQVIRCPELQSRYIMMTFRLWG